MPACSWIKYFDANCTGTVLSASAQNNTNECLSAATNYKNRHPIVPMCQGKIVNASGSAFDSLNIEGANPDTNGNCHVTVEATVPILIPSGACAVMVTVDLHPPKPAMQVRNPPPPCS